MLPTGVSVCLLAERSCLRITGSGVSVCHVLPVSSAGHCHFGGGVKVRTQVHESTKQSNCKGEIKTRSCDYKVSLKNTR